MTPKPEILARAYRAALRRHLKAAPKGDLGSATRIGRRAVAQGLGTLELAAIHEEAVIGVVSGSELDAKARDRVLYRAAAFFAAAMLPLEQTRSAAKEMKVRMVEIRRDLRRRTRELQTSKRSLEKEITRRRAVETSLRQSEKEATRMLAESKRMEDRLRRLTRGILSVQEEERKRISRDLHDIVAQMLASIQIQLAVLKKEASGQNRNLVRKVSITQQLVNKSVDTVHHFARTLRPTALDDLGLVAAIHSLVKAFSTKTGVRVHLTGYANPDPLSTDQRTMLYRVTQEALANVARHAKASRMDIVLRKHPESVHMVISDNGTGFDLKKVGKSKASRRLGLLGMRERVEMIHGTLQVASVPGQGTTIDITVPIPSRPGRKEPAP